MTETADAATNAVAADRGLCGCRETIVIIFVLWDSNGCAGHNNAVKKEESLLLLSISSRARIILL